MNILSNIGNWLGSNTATRIINGSVTIFSIVPGIAAMASGQSLSAKTNGRLQLNNFVPEQFKAISSKTGQIFIARPVRKFENFLTRHLNENTAKTISTIAISPILEETVCRGPVWAISFAIDSFALPFFKNEVVDTTANLAIKSFLALISSTVFTYMHTEGRPIQPGRAAQLFTLGMIFSYLTLASNGGVSTPIVAHMIHNFCLYMLIGEI